MLERILTWSIERRGIVLAATALLVVAGLVAFARLPFDAFPDTTPVQVAVNAEAPALGPLEVERQVVLPVEQVLAGLPGLAHSRSVARHGFAQVVVTFADGTDPMRARQAVSERLLSLDWPDALPRPTLGPLATGMGESFHYLVTGEGLSLQELRAAQDTVLRPQLLAVPGVAELNSWGGLEKQVHVVLDLEALAARGLAIHDVAEALERNHLNASGGVLAQGGEATLVQGSGLLRGTADAGAVVVSEHDGIPVLVRDVGRVIPGHALRHGAVTADGRGEAVLGLGFVMMGESARDVTRRLEERLEKASRSLPPGARAEVLLSRTTLVDEVLDTVRTNLLEGALLVIAVLFAFLGSFRAGLIVALAIPLSMLFAFDAMVRVGIAGSLMSLGALDFGLVVDAHVVVVENAARRLAADTTGRSVRDVVRDAVLEVRRPTLFGELIIAIVYLPLLALEGVEGKLFRPMALTVLFALLGSLVLSLTLTPALASLALRRGASGHGDNRLVRALREAYRPVLERALASRRAVLAAAVVVVVAALALGTRLGAEFVPRLDEGSLVVNTVRLASVSLEESARAGTQLEQLLLREFPDEIERAWTRTGKAEVATDPMGIEVSDVFVTLKRRSEWTRARTQSDLARQVSDVAAGFPGMRAILTQPIEMRVNEMVAGARADVAVKVHGTDLDVLRDRAIAVREALERVPGAADVAMEPLTGAPVLQVEVDREAIARQGLSAEHVLEVVAAIAGLEVAELREGLLRVPLVVKVAAPAAADPAALGALVVVAPGGRRLPLSSLARIERVETPSSVQHEWGQRRVIVQCNVRGRDVASFVGDARRTLESAVDLPPGYHLAFGGQFEHLQRAQRRLAVVVPLALALVVGLLVVTYGRWLDALRVFTGVPFAVVGGVLALAARDLPFSVSAAVGFIALSGVAVLDDILLVSAIRAALARGLALEDAVRDACLTRLRPVLMTATVAALGFLPMALSTGVGAEVQRPLATVVIGGVVSSTLLTLVVLPALYVAVERRLGSPREA